MKVLVDMNLSPLWVPFFSEHGIEASHWQNIGAANARDIDILSFAAAHNFVIFTHDLDFGALLAHGGARRPSVIQLRCQDILPQSAGQLVLGAIAATRDHLEQGALVSVEESRNRIRVLPVQATDIVCFTFAPSRISFLTTPRSRSLSRLKRTQLLPMLAFGKSFL
jgi:predicted nuclease of predicted toxin-antitoxin system